MLTLVVYWLPQPQNAKESFRTAVILLFYMQHKCGLDKIRMFLQRTETKVPLCHYRHTSSRVFSCCYYCV